MSRRWAIFQKTEWEKGVTRWSWVCLGEADVGGSQGGDKEAEYGKGL